MSKANSLIQGRAVVWIGLLNGPISTTPASCETLMTSLPDFVQTPIRWSIYTGGKVPERGNKGIHSRNKENIDAPKNCDQDHTCRRGRNCCSRNELAGFARDLAPLSLFPLAWCNSEYLGNAEHPSSLS